MIGQESGRFQKRNHLGVSRQNPQLSVESWHFDSIDISLEDLALRSDDAQLNLVSHSGAILARARQARPTPLNAERVLIVKGWKLTAVSAMSLRNGRPRMRRKKPVAALRLPPAHSVTSSGKTY